MPKRPFGTEGADAPVQEVLAREPVAERRVDGCRQPGR